MSRTPQQVPGRVTLIGAGPGDPGLLTCRGLECLRRAQAVVYDALVDPSLLDEVPASAQRVDAGKRAGKHTLTQDQIQETMRDLARQGLYVVRLKGGDPYLFGRGAEEIAYLTREGITVDMVPGVTSGIAAPACAGIPVTHRELARTVTFVTAHEATDGDKQGGQSATAARKAKKSSPPGAATALFPGLDVESLARLVTAGGTVCFYMGFARLELLAQALTGAGLSPQTPAALVQWGTRPQQRSVRGTVSDLAAKAAAAGLGSPAIIVVGPTAGLDEPGLDFFTRRPLFGQRILITRTRDQASDLRRMLEELGAAVMEAPTIELVPPTKETLAHVDATLRDMQQPGHKFNWIMLTSVNGVTVLAERLAKLGLDARHFYGVKFAVIGEPTAQALWERCGIKADLVPTRFVAESLAASWLATQDAKDQQVLLLRADIARPELPRILREAGAAVTELVIYKTKAPAALPQEVVAALQEKRVDWITFTSASTARNLHQLLGADHKCLRACRLASIGPVTTAALAEQDWAPTVEAGRHDIPGLVEAIVMAVRAGLGATAK